MNSAPFRPQLTPDFVVRSLHLKVPVLPRPNLAFTRVTSDSRKVIPGCLFVALQGEKFDGHQFIEQAIAQGARGILCRRGTPISTLKELCVFQVEDSLNTYRRLAAAWRREFPIPVVAIAGSAGKTTTKELLAAIFRGKWSDVLKTQGSQNGFVGIPITLLELRPEHQAAIIEIGIDDIGAMQQHMTVVSANLSLLTVIGPEHLEKLRDLPTVAREEGIALSHVARTGGTVAINLDDPWIRPHVTTLREGRKIPYSLEGATSNIDMVSGQISPDGKKLQIQGLGIESASFPLPLPGKHNATNLLAAVTLALGLGLTVEEIQLGLQTFEGAEGRSEVRTLPGGMEVICDYYNAQPASVEAGLDLLALVAKDRATSEGRPIQPRWACLGDMLELGPDQEKFHRNLAQKILELQLENVLLLGPRMKALESELKARQFHGNCTHFSGHAELASALTEGIQPGEAILIKGSRGMKMEEVWKILESYAASTWKVPVESQNPAPHS